MTRPAQLDAPGYLFSRRDCEMGLEPLHPELALVRVVCVCGWKGAAASGVVPRPGVVRCPSCGTTQNVAAGEPIVLTPVTPRRDGMSRRRRMA